MPASRVASRSDFTGLLALGINVLVTLLTVVVVVWQLNNTYREVADRAALTASNLAQKKARTLLSQFETLDLLMDRLTRKVRLADVSPRYRTSLHEILADEVDVFPFVSRFLLLDPAGRVIQSSANLGTNGEVVLCPPFPHRTAPDVMRVIGSGEEETESAPGCEAIGSIYVSSILHDRSGRIQYELVALMEPETLGAGFFNEMTWELGEKARYRVITGDGRFLVGFRDLPPGLSYAVSGEQEAVGHTMFSHRDGMGAVGEVPGFDLRVEIVYSNDEVLLAGWRDTLILTVTIGVVFLLSWFLLSWFIVTMLRRHEDAIQEGEQRYNRSLSYAAVGAWEWDVASGKLYWSDETFRIFGVDQKGWAPSYDNFIALVHPDDRQMVRDALARSLEQGDEYELVHRVILPNQTVRWMQERGGVSRDAQGLPITMNGICVDITAQYQAQKALTESESRFRTAFDSTAIGNLIIDSEGIILDANRASEAIFGYSVDELAGSNVSMLMPDPDRSRHDGYLKAYLATGEGAIIGQGQDLKGIRKNGEIFPMHLGVGVMENDGDLSFIGSISDLSDVKNLEIQLRHSQKMDAIGQLAGGVAHDFNNMLGIAIGGLDLLKMKLTMQSADDKLIELLDKIHESLWRGAKMTQNLLDFSRQDQGQGATVDLCDLVGSSLELIRKSLTTSVQVEEALADDTWQVLVNPDDFQNALINLSINARDAMPQGGVLCLSSANVHVADEYADGPLGLPPGDYVRFSVADTGTGMSAAVKEKVFEPFFSTKDKGKGTGLGLSMVYSFVKRANGGIDLESQPGEGTTFHIYLPRAQDVAVSTGQAVSEAQTRSGVIANGETVLIVDDEAMLAEVAREMFSGMGFTPLVCTSSREALRLLEAGELDIRLLFSDIVMPELDGVQLALAAHRLHPSLPILLTSGYAQDVAVNCEGEDEQAWCQALLDQRLPKPYSIANLLARVKEVLAG